MKIDNRKTLINGTLKIMNVYVLKIEQCWFYNPEMNAKRGKCRDRDI